MQSRLVRSGAVLFTVGLFTGIWSAAALTGKVAVKIPHMALAAHLNALLGGMWLVVVAVSFPMLRYQAVQLKRLAWLVSVPAWANWLVTLVASFIGERGLDYGGTGANNAVALALQVLVVLPALVGSVYWTRGFFVRPRGA